MRAAAGHAIGCTSGGLSRRELRLLGRLGQFARRSHPEVDFRPGDAEALPFADASFDVPDGPPFFQFSDEDAFAGLLADAGLADVAVETIEFMHRLPKPARATRSGP